MKNIEVYLLRSPTLAAFGDYSYSSISLKEAREMLADGKFTSGIRFQWDADLLRDLLGIYIPINRGEIRMEVGDVAVVFEFPPVDPAEATGDRGKTPLCIGVLRRKA